MKQPKRIDQLVNSFTDHDAVSNHIRKQQERLRQRGFSSDIYAVSDSCQGGPQSQPFAAWRGKADAVAIYHHSIGNEIPVALLKSAAYKIAFYHNVTPAKFFAEFLERQFHLMCNEGVRQLPLLGLTMDRFWAASEYNASELVAMGLPVATVLPVVRDYGRLASLRAGDDPLVCMPPERPVLLFVGRVATHKAQHDLLWLTKGLKTRGLTPLMIVAGGGVPNYVDYLQRLLTPQLGLKASVGERLDPAADVWFTGEVSDARLHALYKRATLLVSMSEHEGFCVPLVEAMHFGLPIAAHRAAAIPETLAGAGVTFDKERDDVPRIVHELLQDAAQMAALRARSLARAAHYAEPRLIALFDQAMDEALADFDARRQDALPAVPVTQLDRWGYDA